MKSQFTLRLEVIERGERFAQEIVFYGKAKRDIDDILSASEELHEALLEWRRGEAKRVAKRGGK